MRIREQAMLEGCALHTQRRVMTIARLQDSAGMSKGKPASSIAGFSFVFGLKLHGLRSRWNRERVPLLVCSRELLPLGLF
jgi:hypothetical protein